VVVGIIEQIIFDLDLMHQRRLNIGKNSMLSDDDCLPNTIRIGTLGQYSEEANSFVLHTKIGHEHGMGIQSCSYRGGEREIK